MFCQEHIDFMKEADIPFFDYPGEEATRENVEEMLISRPEAHLLFYNHGDEKGLVAQDGGYIIDSSNVELLKNRIVYTLACLWGKDGGWEAHRIGARAVHCYTEIVGFMTGALKEFQEAFNYGFGLLHTVTNKEGPDFERILEYEKIRMTELSDKLMARGDFMGAMWMSRNRDSLVWYNGASEPPESKCFFRRLAVKLFGNKVGWNLCKLFVAFIGGVHLGS